jgi:hypothetical protein
VPKTPTARSLDYLRARGWQVAVVESWIPKTVLRRDLWSFADVLAAHPGAGFLLVQVTSVANVSSRLKKVQASGEAAFWLRCGGRIEVHGWRGPQVKIVEVLSADLSAITRTIPRKRPSKQRELPGISP